MRSSLTRVQWAVYARHLAASRRPILLGPWRSEVGFEILYWIPFLRAFREHFKIARDRLITIGRGGSAVWYDTAGTSDLYEHLPVEAVRVLGIRSSQQTGSIKQHTDEGWERHVCALTAASLGITKYHRLSPSWMYQLLAPWWEGHQPLRWLDTQILNATKMPAPPLPADLQAKLPPHYVAMRWYARPTWPMRDDLLLWTRQLVESVSAKIPVIIVDSGFQTDDHADIHLGAIPNTVRLSDLIPQTPLNNLAIQSAVIARAKGYVGTYGGMAQGAMRWGVPTLALYDQFGQTAPAHLSLTQSLSLQTGTPFVATTPKDLNLVLPLMLQKITSEPRTVSTHVPTDMVLQ